MAKPPSRTDANMRATITSPHNRIASERIPRISSTLAIPIRALRAPLVAGLEVRHILVHHFELAGPPQNFGLSGAPVPPLRAQQRKPAMVSVDEVQDQA